MKWREHVKCDELYIITCLLLLCICSQLTQIPEKKAAFNRILQQVEKWVKNADEVIEAIHKPVDADIEKFNVSNFVPYKFGVIPTLVCFIIAGVIGCFDMHIL